MKPEAWASVTGAAGPQEARCHRVVALCEL